MHKDYSNNSLFVPSFHHNIGMNKFEWIEETDLCQLCGRTFDMHHIDFNYELHFHITDIQQMLENSLSNKGSLGVSDNQQLIKI